MNNIQIKVTDFQLRQLQRLVDITGLETITEYVQHVIDRGLEFRRTVDDDNPYTLPHDDVTPFVEGMMGSPTKEEKK